MTVSLPKGSFILVNGTPLSEHNRSGGAIQKEMLGVSARTIVGTMKRQSFVGKRTISVSWEHLPALDDQTVDGKAGRNTIRDLVDQDWTNNLVPYTIVIHEVDDNNVQTDTTISAFVDSYSEELIKRYAYQHWNVSISFVEV